MRFVGWLSCWTHAGIATWLNSRTNMGDACVKKVEHGLGLDRRGSGLTDGEVWALGFFREVATERESSQ